MGIAEKMAGRIATLAAEGPSEAPALPSAPPESGEVVKEAPALEEQAPAQSPQEAIEEENQEQTGEPEAPPDEAAVKRSILEEKLHAIKAKRAAQEAEKEERRIRAIHAKNQAAKELEETRKQLEETKAKWARLQTGSFKEGLMEMGRDPLQTFKELQREAVEADTPEGKIRMLERQFQEKLESITKPLESKLAEMQAEHARQAEASIQARMQADFVRTVQDPEYEVLREAYEDEDLLSYANNFRNNPESFHAAARQYGVRLTQPTKGFTMREILSVLKAAQVAHDEARKQRRERLREKSPGMPKPATVNGASAPRNAGSTITNDLASTRASGSGPKLSRQERIEAEIARLGRG